MFARHRTCLTFLKKPKKICFKISKMFVNLFEIYSKTWLDQDKWMAVASTILGDSMFVKNVADILWTRDELKVRSFTGKTCNSLKNKPGSGYLCQIEQALKPEKVKRIESIFFSPDFKLLLTPFRINTFISFFTAMTHSRILANNPKVGHDLLKKRVSA